MNKKQDAPFLLEPQNLAGLQDHLSRSGRLLENERIELLEVAGEGNMNVVLRAITGQRSFILKQSLPWVHRFPTISAPRERILTEFEFYNTVRLNEQIRKFTPEMYWMDTESFILCMEDLGNATDFTRLYKKGENLEKSEMADLARVISELHVNFQYGSQEKGIRNVKMLELNHAHIFVLPLQAENGFDLNAVMPGLKDATDKFRNDRKLKQMAMDLGRVYLSDSGTRLLHGDYYPGSWLRTANGFRMIDPEFCFKGPAEFELGITVAHLKMAQQNERILKDLFIYYHFDSRFDGSLFSKFAGMEIIRRIIGLAQLPLDLNLKERLQLLDEAYELVMNG